jgi:hypothetical protein
MKRRNLILLAGTALVLPRVIRAQQTERVRRIGYFTADTGNPGNLLGGRTDACSGRRLARLRLVR